MGRVSRRAVRDVAGGSVGCETAPAGVLLVVAAGDPYRVGRVGIGDGPLAAMPGGFLIGAQSHYGRSALGGTASGVRVDLPWAVAVRVFGSLLADLAEGTAPVAELPGARNLADQVADTGSARPVVRWLRGLTGSHGAPPPLAVQALERIEAGATGVGQLAVELDCSRGHLHRTIRLATGLPPLTLIRVARIHRLIATASRELGATLADTAARSAMPTRPTCATTCVGWPDVRRGSCSAAGDISTLRRSSTWRGSWRSALRGPDPWS